VKFQDQDGKKVRVAKSGTVIENNAGNQAAQSSQTEADAG
jgi:hypothetical protein